MTPAKWIWFFRVAGALGMLTKGPIAVLIPLAGLCGWWWSRDVLRERARDMRLASSLVIAAIPLVVWFAAASAVEGRDVYEQLVRAETIDRFIGDSTKSKEHRHPFYYVPHFFARLAPWSFLAVVGVRQRGRRDLQVWWLIAPFILLSLVPSKRADRLLPLLPAACVLAAAAFHRFEAWWFERDQARRSRFVLGVLLFTTFALLAAGAAVAARMRDVVPDGAPISLTGALGAALVIAALTVLIAVLRRRERVFNVAFPLALLLGIATYQHVLSGWAKLAYG